MELTTIVQLTRAERPSSARDKGAQLFETTTARAVMSCPPLYHKDRG